MAEAVAHAFDAGEHLAVQAGTGTGKSLAYLVPAIARAVEADEPVVVSTATIALQRQLVDRDLPRLAESLSDALPRSPEFALLKGRGNYLCLNKIHNGAAAEPDDAAAGGALRADRRQRTGPRRAAADRLVVDHRHRRSRRADTRRAGPVVVAGERLGAGMHRRRPLPVRHGLFRGAGPRQGRQCRCRRHQPCPSGDRRHLRRRGAARTQPAGGRRGARTRRPGDLGGHRRAVGDFARCRASAVRPAGRSGTRATP